MQFLTLTFLRFLMKKFDESLFLKHESLKKYCTFKVGGNAKFLFVAKTTQQLIAVSKYCELHNIKFKVIGLGANLVFDDLGYDGAIIVNKSNKILLKDDVAFVDSGVYVSTLISKCVERNLGGIEKLAGIPSTIGGGIVNSLGAFNTNLFDFVEQVECYNLEDLNTKIILNNEECKFGYRTSIFKNNQYLITRVKLKLKVGNSTEIRENMISALTHKKSTQPLNYPSAGSVFKRCEIIPAKVIDELGLKGKIIGDAQISTKHAGFIVNCGSASSKDIKELVGFIKSEVKKHTNIDLETEIEFVN